MINDSEEMSGPESVINMDSQDEHGPPMPPKGSNPKDILRWVFTSPNVHATTLLIVMVDAYGTEALNWHPTTIRMQLEQDNGITLLPTNMDKLMAAICLISNNYFYKNLSRFIDLCHAIVGNGFNPTQVVPPSVSEMAWAISEALVIYPPEGPYGKDEPFCKEICDFVAASLKEEGFIKPPDILRIATGADLSDQVKDTFSDDPDFYAALYQSQEEKTAQINSLIKDGITQMIQQIDNLQLINGNSEKLAERFRKDIYNEISQINSSN